MIVRALFDSGSKASFVSERVAQQLRLLRRKINATVSGLQRVITGKITQAVSLILFQNICHPYEFLLLLL